VIRARGLTKRYGDHVVLDRLDLEIRAGERVAILGVNGAGKTTLLRCVLGLTGFGGHLEVDGETAGSAAREVRRRVGYVPQSPPVFDLSLAGFLDLFARLREIDPGAARARAAGLGLDPAGTGDRALRELSGGMLQKAYLALALAAETPVLLLDEPTASLDPGSRRDFLAGLREVGSETTMVLASHRLEEIEPLADRLVVLGAGRIVFDGTLEELWLRTRTSAGLWVGVAPESRARAARGLAEIEAVRGVHPNGSGVRAEVEGGTHLDVLVELRRRGIQILEFHTRPPALEEVLDRLVETGDGSGGGSR